MLCVLWVYPQCVLSTLICPHSLQHTRLVVIMVLNVRQVFTFSVVQVLNRLCDAGCGRTGLARTYQCTPCGESGFVIPAAAKVLAATVSSLEARFCVSCSILIRARAILPWQGSMCARRASTAAL